jgi:hypothetical protein
MARISVHHNYISSDHELTPNALVHNGKANVSRTNWQLVKTAVQISGHEKNSKFTGCFLLMVLIHFGVLADGHSLQKIVPQSILAKLGSLPGNFLL